MTGCSTAIVDGISIQTKWAEALVRKKTDPSSKTVKVTKETCLCNIDETLLERKI